MRKSRAIGILVTTVALIAGYIVWATWDPAPTIQSMRFHKNVDAVARSAAEADFRAHHPRARKLTWHRFLNRLARPYQREAPPPIPVAIIPYTDGGQLLAISYPRGSIYLGRRLDHGAWGRQFVENPAEP